MKKDKTESPEVRQVDNIRQIEEATRLKIHLENLRKEYGIQNLNDVVKRINYEEQNRSDYGTMVETAKEWFEVEEEDERNRFLGKTDFERSDAEVIGGKGTAYIRVILSDIYQMLKERYCRVEDMTLEEFDDMVKTSDEYEKYGDKIWENAKFLMVEHPILIEDVSIGLMRGLISKGRKGRYEYRDIIVGPKEREKELAKREEMIRKVRKHLD